MSFNIAIDGPAGAGKSTIAKKIAKELGLTILELNEHGENRKLNKKPVVKADPKYRNPNNHKEVWAGRGKRPSWLNREIESGKTLESFLIV